ncbi:hypothetical protein ACHAPT_004260 [Fusarium lateritium]
MVNCTYNITKWWEDDVSYPEPYEDIEGIGVLVGFLGTAWLMIAMILVHYLVFFDPELDPFADTTCSGGTEELEAPFEPNPIDTMLLRFIRRCSRRLLDRFDCCRKDKRSSSLSRLQQSMIKCILNFVDLQLIAGLSILISGFLSLNQDLSAYHWSLVVYLAWLSNITHLSGLTALRGYLHSHPRERGWKLALMFLFMILLLVALGPTAFFNWWSIDSMEPGHSFSVAKPNSLARCFFSPGESLKAYREQKKVFEQEERQELIGVIFTPFSRSKAFQSATVSMVLLIANFFARALRVFPSVSKFLVGGLRPRVRHLAAQALCKLSRSRRPFSRILNKRQWNLIVVKPCLATFLVVPLYVDIFASTQSEIYWLLISSLWATLNLAGLKSAASAVRLNEMKTTWTFGQTLPVLMLLAPAITAAGAFLREPEDATTPPDPRSPADMEFTCRLAGQDCQSSGDQPGDMATAQTVVGSRSEEGLGSAAESTSLLLPLGSRVPSTHVTMQLETDQDSQELTWLQRDYYQTNWAPAICFWFCMEISSVGIIIILITAEGGLSTQSPISLMRVLWVWALVAQPVTKFASILINIAGEEFQGAARWLNRPVVCHGLAFTWNCLGVASSFITNIYGMDALLNKDWLRSTGIFSLMLTCAMYGLGLSAYAVLMFFKAR